MNQPWRVFPQPRRAREPRTDARTASKRLNRFWEWARSNQSCPCRPLKVRIFWGSTVRKCSVSMCIESLDEFGILYTMSVCLPIYLSINPSVHPPTHPYAMLSNTLVPVVPHKAVAEVSRIAHYRRSEMLWCMGGRANPLTDRKVGALLFGVAAGCSGHLTHKSWT